MASLKIAAHGSYSLVMLKEELEHLDSLMQLLQSDVESMSDDSYFFWSKLSTLLYEELNKC